MAHKRQKPKVLPPVSSSEEEELTIQPTQTTSSLPSDSIPSMEPTTKSAGKKRPRANAAEGGKKPPMESAGKKRPRAMEDSANAAEGGKKPPMESAGKNRPRAMEDSANAAEGGKKPPMESAGKKRPRAVEDSAIAADGGKKPPMESAEKKRPSVVEDSANAAEGGKKPPMESAEKKRPRVVEDSANAAEDGKKLMFQRIWSEEDELILLNGIVEYVENKGLSPSSDLVGFLVFIKNRFHFDASKQQLGTKLRKLRIKYGRTNKGLKPNFTKTHDRKCYEVWLKIWGTDGVIPKLKSSLNKSIEPAKKEKEKLGCEEKMKNCEEKEKKHRIAELKLYIERSDLLRESAELILDQIRNT